MSFEQVKAYLAGLGLNALEFDVSSATVELAAVAVGCEPRRHRQDDELSGGRRARFDCAGGRCQGEQHKV